MDVAQRVLAGHDGYEVNEYNGVYSNGKEYSHSKKLEVAASIVASQESSLDGSVNVSSIAKECKVSRYYVRKVRDELRVHGRILRENEKTAAPLADEDEGGFGSRSLDDDDVFVLINLYFEEPSRSLRSYARELEMLTGTIVSESTISRLFRYEFPYKATLQRPNIVPIDKFRPENCERALQYLTYISTINPVRIKFGDEKHLKGRDVFNRHNRVNPFTGLVPPLVSPPDFRNTYSITGFCGIDRRSSPLYFTIHDGTNDSLEFQVTVESALQAGWFHPWDYLVLDNAAIHDGGSNDNLDDWLWDNFRICVLFLPARSPELNPIELVWNAMVQRLKLVSVRHIRNLGADGVAIVSGDVLKSTTFEDVEGMYRHARVM